MEIRSASISNHPNNNINARSVVKGQRGVCCLSCGIRMPKAADQSTPAKVTEIVVESFMRRPALSAEATDGIYRRANDRVLLNQSPQYPSFVSTNAVFFVKNKFIFATAGDNVVFHFVNGVLKNVFKGSPDRDALCLGNLSFSSPKVSGEIPFGKGENTFLLCSGKFAAAFSENQLEQALIRATHVTQKGKKTISQVNCSAWLKALWDELGYAVNSPDEYSAVAFTLPTKRKSTKALVIGIVAAVIFLLVAFLAFGFFTRSKGPKAPAPLQQGQEGDMLPPDQNTDRPVGPNGETPPDPPTRPSQD